MSGHARELAISVRVPPCRPLTQIADTAVLAEELGFAGVAVPDSPLLWRDAIAALTLIAARTRRLSLTLAVTNFALRDPCSLASTGRTIEELASGRFRMGIGVGDSSVTLMGLQRVTGAALRDGLDVLYGLSSGPAAKPDHPRGPQLQDPAQFPVYVAAEGPRNMALAAQKADGVITQHANSAGKHELIRNAAESAGRAVPRHIAVALTCVTDDIERDARIVKPFVMRAAQISPDRFARAGFVLSLPSEPVQLPDGTDLGHARDQEAAIEFASGWISDELAVWYARNACVFGRPAEVASRFRQLAVDGVDELVLHDGHSFGLPNELMSRVAGDVLPLLQASGSGSPRVPLTAEA